MDGGTEGSAEVGGARSDVAKVLVMSKFGHGFNVGGSLGEAREDCANISTVLHGDDAELIFFVNPDEEGLGIIVEDASTSGPVTVETASIKESVSLFEKEMIGCELVALFFGHRAERVESTSKFTLKSVASLDNLLLDLIALLISNSWTKRVVSKITTDTDTSGPDHGGVFGREWWAL